MGWVGQTRDGPGPALGQAGSQALGFKGPQACENETTICSK